MPEKKVWEVLKPGPFITSDQKYCICVDTLGQDRPLSDDEKRFCLKTSQKFTTVWEKFEADKLVSDRNQRVETMNVDSEFLKENGDKIKEDEETYIDTKFRDLEDEVEDENEKSLMASKYRLDCITEMYIRQKVGGEGPDAEELVPNEFRDRFDKLRDYKVIKYGRFMQSLLYLL